jgi:hypothetical protein
LAFLVDFSTRFDPEPLVAEARFRVYFNLRYAFSYANQVSGINNYVKARAPADKVGMYHSRLLVQDVHELSSLLLRGGGGLELLESLACGRDEPARLGKIGPVVSRAPSRRGGLRGGNAFSGAGGGSISLSARPGWLCADLGFTSADHILRVVISQRAASGVRSTSSSPLK